MCIIENWVFYVRVVNLTTNESAALVIQEVSRIIFRRTDHSIDEILKLYKDWKLLHENINGLGDRKN